MRVFTNQSVQELKDKLTDQLLEAYENKEKEIDPQLLRNLERMVFLQIIDSKWKDHLYAMDSLREGIGLRAYGQRDPLIEYKREAFGMFSQMIGAIEEDAVQTIFKLQPAKPDRFQGVFSSVPKEFSHPEADKFQVSSQGENLSEFGETPKEPAAKPIQSHHPKVGRNDPCPCGSSKKYKKCCGK
jgi:preprotein translocase subunit SecA